MHFRKAILCTTFVMLMLCSLSAAAFVGGANWDSEAAAAGVEPSYTLPILYIKTENGKAVDQKENYVSGELLLSTSYLGGG